jgi:hypothetical protein
MFPSGTPVPLTLFETVSYSPLVVIHFLDSRILVTNRRTSLKGRNLVSGITRGTEDASRSARRNRVLDPDSADRLVFLIC